MGLTDYENEQLRDLEMRLAADDPALAKSLARTKDQPRRSMVLGVLVAVLGIAVTLGGLSFAGAWTVPVGVAGFVLALIGALMIFKPPRPGIMKPRRKLMERLEQRWSNRKNGRS